MNSTRWLDEDQLRAWRAYQRMQSRLAAHLNRQLQTDSGLSLADYEILVHLTDVPEGRLRPFELQRSLHWEQSRLSHHLTRMQRRGLISREGCPDDRRGAFIALTEDGRRAIEEAAPGHVEATRRLFFDQLAPEQVALLEQLATTVLQRLDTAAPQSAP
ncbi:MarR family transcriptional regulator [Streptomyces sp. ACA25]|uniref:MarR family winged helix-turn-helix transcriptional regulator n=1 Tax=Streptomyces sp. ACA25 TaxID=3022596 RepID=UPI002307D1C4|nr:MarR family transcriptional regulator [Streptomyces sp. ACA25]MDB1086581.1 MarR family transcriptional regulator [Streptomyces sp. ACA25]